MNTSSFLARLSKLKIALDIFLDKRLTFWMEKLLEIYNI